MFSLIVILFIAGLCLFLAEVLVPGWVLGIMGILTMVLAVVLCYIQYGVAIGTLTLCGATVFCSGGFFLWLRYFPQTFLGKRLVNSSIAGESAPPLPNQPTPGAEGVTLTDLRPGGAARFGGQRLDVVSESEYIARDVAVCVTQIEGNRIVVRPVASFQSES